MSRKDSPGFREALAAFQNGDLERARTLATSEVETAPSANAHHLLGLVHCRLGDASAGVPHLKSAVGLEPGNAAFQVMLARALIDSGRPGEVLAMAEPPAITSAATLAQWQARAEAADSAGDRAAALAAWRRVAAALPNDWRAWTNFGNALAAEGQWIEAGDALAQAAALNPAEPAIRANLSGALVHAGRQHQALLQFDEAEAAFRQAHEIDPADTSIIRQLGVALERTNRLDELGKLIEDAAASGTPEGELHYLRAVLARREGRLEEARQLLLKAGPEQDPIRWNALRAKIADSLGEPAEAFESATAMNRAAREQAVGSGDSENWERDTRAYRADLHALAGMITPRWAEQVPRLDEPASRRVSFLLGFPRSGTTLLDTFLMGHPKVEVLEEKQLVAKAADVVGGSAGLKGVSIPRLRAARQAYFAALRSLVPAEFDGLVVDKFPLDMAAAPVIEAVFPRAPMIFAQRHPCDVVLSGFMQPIGVVNFSSIEAAADYYDAMMSIWTAAREAMDLNVHVVVYEELVSDPEAVLRPLLDFLGLDWDGRVLDHQRTARERGTIVTPTYDQVTEPITKRPVGRWKQYRKQLESVLPILLPWAKRLGYSD